MQTKTFSVLATLVLCTGLAGPAHALTVIDTTPSWTSSQSSAWDYAAQTFTVPALDTQLDSFELGVYSQSGVGGSYILDIYDWNTASNHVVGASLFNTGPHALPDGTMTFVAHPIGVSLAAGGDYAAVVSLLPDGGALPSAARGVAFIGSDVYAGGYADWTDGPITSAWFWGGGTSPAPYDLAFRAEFSGALVPLPAAAWMGLILLSGIGATSAVRRKRRNS